MSKAILLHIDGCRVDTLQAANTKNIYKLIESGAWTLNAQTDTPPLTLPVHFSIFTSMHSGNHGVLTNTATPRACPSLTGIMEWLKLHGKTTAMYFNWEPLKALSPPDYLDSSMYLNTSMNRDGDMKVAEAAARDLLENKIDFSFIYLGCLDEIGHSTGFGSDEYRASLERADHAVGHLLRSLEKAGVLQEYTILFESDHGGIDHDHAETISEVMTIPWVINGPAVRPGELPHDRPVTVIDTAPTLCHCLGIQSPPNWKGRPVLEAFTT